jgi:hypothetical protein
MADILELSWNVFSEGFLTIMYYIYSYLNEVCSIRKDILDKQSNTAMYPNLSVPEFAYFRTISELAARFSSSRYGIGDLLVIDGCVVQYDCVCSIY